MRTWHVRINHASRLRFIIVGVFQKKTSKIIFRIWYYLRISFSVSNNRDIITTFKKNDSIQTYILIIDEKYISLFQPNKYRRKGKDFNGSVTCTTNVVKLSRLWYSFNYLLLLKKQPNHTKQLPRYVIYYSVCISYVANQFAETILISTC